MLDNSFLMAKIAGLSLIGERHATLKSTLKAVWRPVAVWRGGVARIRGMLCQKAPQSHHTSKTMNYLWQRCGDSCGDINDLLFGSDGIKQAMIKTLIQRIFRLTVELTEDPKTETVVNIVWTKEEWWREGFDTNSVFRTINREHELELLRDDSKFVIETAAADASPLTCPLDKFSHQHGCYSAD